MIEMTLSSIHRIRNVSCNASSLICLLKVIQYLSTKAAGSITHRRGESSQSVSLGRHLVWRVLEGALLGQRAFTIT